MQKDKLLASLKKLDLSQAAFARLVGVTPRAVTLWLSGERAIPGAVEAYLRLLQMLPSNLLEVEFARLKAKVSNMRDGMIGITFQSGSDTGVGMLVFDDGKVYGADAGAVRYDGSYVFNEATGFCDVAVKVTYPPNSPAVFGICNPYEWSIDVTARFDLKQNSGPIQLKTSIGKVITAQFMYLRSLPEAA